MIFATIDTAAKEFFSSIKQAIIEHFDPPHQMISFTKPVELDASKTTADPAPASDKRRAKIVEVTKQHVIFSGKPRYYAILLVRKDQKFLPLSQYFKGEEGPKINTEESQWAEQSTVQADLNKVQAPDNAAIKGKAIQELRWNATPEDYSQAALSANTKSRDILINALAEVGIQEKQDAKRVYEYWGALPDMRRRNKITEANLWPWGAMLLSFVVQKAGLEPPIFGSAYDAWPSWGRQVEPAALKPGMIVMFSTKLNEQTGNLIGGVFLRNKAGCSEIIIGNVTDRVVIACVALPPASIRMPAQ